MASGGTNGDAEYLTTEQKVALLVAYRDTYQARNHGDAVKAVYADFAKHHGVALDVLRAVIRRDLKANPQLYAGLRKKLFARQGAKRVSAQRRSAAVSDQKPQKPQPPQPPLQKPQTPQTPRTLKRTTVKCPVCAQVVAGSKGETESHEFNGQPCSGEVATCKVCKQRLPVRASDGRMTSHSPGGKTCAGSGRPPYEGRSPKFMAAGITRIVSGGLSSRH